MKVTSADSFDMSEYDSLMMLESKAFSRGIAAMGDKDLDISFAGLKNSSTSFLRFTQIKDGNPISDKALAFLRCTILLWPSLPKNFQHAVRTRREVEVNGRQESRRRGDEVGREAYLKPQRLRSKPIAKTQHQSRSRPEQHRGIGSLQVTDVKSSIFDSARVTAMVVSVAAVKQRVSRMSTEN